MRHFNELRAIVDAHDNVFCSVGTHPHHAAEEPDVTVEELVELARHPKVVAIGEAGLDYHYDNSPREMQKKGFRTHIAAARETGSAARHPCPRGGRRHRAHARRGDARRARFPSCCIASPAGPSLRDGASRSAAMSPSPVCVTFKNAEALRDIALAVPLDRLLVETDAPYLAPEPLRGQDQRAGLVVHTAARLAALRGVSEAEMARATTENFFRLFKKVPRAALHPQSAA